MPVLDRVIARKLRGANDRPDFPEETSLGVAQLINHHRQSQEHRAALFDQALCSHGLAALLGPVIDYRADHAS